MFRRIGLLLMVPLYVFAGSYNPSMLQVYAKVFAKVVYANHRANCTKCDELNVTVLYQPVDALRKDKLSALLRAAFDELPLKNVRISDRPYDRPAAGGSANALFLLPGTEEQVRAAVSAAGHAHRFTFSAEEAYLDFGLIMSLSVTKGVMLLINIDALKRSNIRMDSAILRVSKLVHSPAKGPE